MYEPKTGDRVRVVLEGVARDMEQGDFEIGPALGGNYIAPNADHVVSIELLTPAEPPEGSVVRTVGDGVYQRLGAGWFRAGSSRSVTWLTLTAFSPIVIYAPDSE